MPFETGRILLNEMLARLQELSWEQLARDTIGQAHHRIEGIFDPVGLDG